MAPHLAPFEKTEGVVFIGKAQEKVPVFRTESGATLLDNGFVSCADPPRRQTICARLGREQIDDLWLKWLARLPHPLTAEDRQAGYRHDLSMWQVEFSQKQILDCPLSSHIFFEEIIRENLDIGRPESSLRCTGTTRTIASRSISSRFRKCVRSEFARR